MAEDRPLNCPECDEGITRRDFVRTVSGAAIASGLLRFYDSLSDEQRKVICLPFDHKLRQTINANWAITKPTIEDFFKPDQQALIRDIFKGVTSGADSELLQMRSRGHLRSKSLRFEPSDLLEGEVGRRLEPLGMHDAKPCLEARRHHSGEGHRACRGVAEIDAHEDGLRWAVCRHGSGTHGVTSIVCTVTARSPRSWRFAM